VVPRFPTFVLRPVGLPPPARARSDTRSGTSPIAHRMVGEVEKTAAARGAPRRDGRGRPSAGRGTPSLSPRCSSGHLPNRGPRSRSGPPSPDVCPMPTSATRTLANDRRACTGCVVRSMPARDDAEERSQPRQAVEERSSPRRDPANKSATSRSRPEANNSRGPTRADQRTESAGSPGHGKRPTPTARHTTDPEQEFACRRQGRGPRVAPFAIRSASVLALPTPASTPPRSPPTCPTHGSITRQHLQRQAPLTCPPNDELPLMHPRRLAASPASGDRADRRVTDRTARPR
jgi:hypothetical protein